MCVLLMNHHRWSSYTVQRYKVPITQGMEYKSTVRSNIPQPPAGGGIAMGK